MVTELDSAGSLPAEYHSAFLATAREWFVPDQFWFKANENGNDAALDRGTDPDGWLSTVYSDTALVTQFDDGDTAWPDVGYRPTSSASMPSVVAGMLRALDVHSGHFVLEIGTGTGWNAALLAEIVGAQGLVVTVEVDDNLGSLARERLATAGYSAVDVRIADASKPLEDDQMFDRVIATAGVHIGRFPYWWVESTRPGGVIVAPMRVDMSAGPLVRFVVNEDGTATGHAVSWLQVGFMDMRAHRIPDADVESLRWDDPDADVSTSDLAPWVPLLADDHRWPIAVALPSCQYEVWKHTEQRPHGIAWLHDVQSGSWASVVPAGSKRYTVRQSGPRRLWDEAEAAYRWWQQRGEPPLSAWRWTITPDRQSITLESGD
jgi:protein-L-isoaspartate O-methyltransferase